ncbi:hypothetical protein MGYG_08951 [Nannizzia gypsea CBS 118893]|uniref:Uncharacterized protein n=1 Tax=Arthroderma gypseum (strain ATCC MYA-4604 / CBS 118893) TaxID=535722 RepID=E5R3Y5_ARTGP|nr:hypothetical protein MGYG_08951 [Nannizzia gypsea CBS 118893]EFQ98831.1 hypothetical protein MGYG_08951 [Nannizzia gypsea CBS 118893]
MLGKGVFGGEDGVGEQTPGANHMGNKGVYGGVVEPGPYFSDWVFRWRTLAVDKYQGNNGGGD